MLDFLEQNSQILQLAVSMVLAITTITITLMLHRSSRRSTALGHELLGALAERSDSARLDELAKQAEELSNVDDLAEVMGEALRIGHGRPLDRVRETYWRNPAVPATRGPYSQTRLGVEETRKRLGEKLAGVGDRDAESQLVEFYSDACSFEIGVRSDIAAWVVSAASEEFGWTYSNVKSLMQRTSGELSSAMLHACDFHAERIEMRARAEVVGGVCANYLEMIGRRSSSPLTQTTERQDWMVEISEAMLPAIAGLTYRRNLEAFAQMDAHEFTLFPGETCALLVGAAGACSFSDSHLAMRTLEGIQGMEIAADQDFGNFTDAWEFGLEKFAEYWPTLLESFPIDPKLST
ncbi:MAG: hypothetical protein ACRDKE_12115 [Solirubrobacterales bacterium]